jgi:gas vesicle structural protein
MSRRNLGASRFDSIQLFGNRDNTSASLLDLIDNVLNKGVVLKGEILLGVANVDLIYAQLSVLLAAVDRVFEPSPGKKRIRRATRGASKR